MAPSNAVIAIKRTLALAIIIFLFHPIFLFTIRAGGLDLSEILINALFWKSLWFTLYQALLSLFLSLLIGLPGALWLSQYRGKFKPHIHAFLTIFLMLPVIFVILGFISLFGEESLINKIIFFLFGEKLRILYSLPAILIAHIFYNVPLVIKVVSRAWEEAGKKEEQAALLLGASKFRIFSSITLPKLLPPTIAVSLIVFVFCYMSFAIPLILGGSPSYSTLEVLIYEKVKLELNLTFAMGIALLELLISLLFFWACTRFIHKYTFIPLHPSDIVERSKTSTAFKIYLIFISLFLILPLLTLTAESISGLFTNHIIFKSNLIHSVAVSFIVAITSGIIATLLALLTSLIIRTLPEEKMYDLIFFIPMGISSLFLGICYLISYQKFFLLGWGVPVLIILHSTINFPFAYRIIRGSFVKISPQIWQAAEHFAPNWRIRLGHITIPLLKNSIINALLITIALSLGEFNATMIVAGGRLKTVPILIYELLGSYRLESALLIGLIYTLIALSIFYFVERRGGYVNTS